MSWYKNSSRIIKASDDLNNIFDKQNFYRHDTYGPQDKTVFYSTQDDDGDKGIFIINDVKDGKIRFSTIRTPTFVLTGNIKAGVYSPCTRDDMIKWFKDNPNYVW